MLDIERQYWNAGHVSLAGVDEAGRGPLAGPVVAAAVIIEREYAEREAGGLLAGLNDSKKLTAPLREEFYRRLTAGPGVRIGVGFADNDEIDSINILKATYLAMARALTALGAAPDLALVDGRPAAGLPCRSEAIVQGDGKSLSIAAASVVAKVVRDAHMLAQAARYPAYGFAAHKGYGTEQHIQALFEHGPCELHRFTFRPVREAADMHARFRLV